MSSHARAVGEVKPMRTFVSVSVAVCSLVSGLLLATCGPSQGGAVGDASVRITPAGGTEQVFNYDPAKGEIVATPPSGGLFTATFTANDPAMTLAILVDGRELREGEAVTFPLSGGLTSSDLLVSLAFEGHTYASDQPATAGDLTVEVLRLTDDAVDFRASFNVTLGASMVPSVDGGASGHASVNVLGFLEAHEGNTAGADGGL